MVIRSAAAPATTVGGDRILPRPQQSFMSLSPAVARAAPTVSGALSTTVAKVPGAPVESIVNLTEQSSSASMPDPTGIDIPAIGVAAPVVPLGRNPDGSAEVPAGVTVAGWYDLGPKPGQLGPAVILGHVDALSGPAVFFSLKHLVPGDVITVRDSTVLVSFAVQRVMTFTKDEFPTASVFGSTPDAELRLITCGGPFDRSIGHYKDNVVVYALRIS
jgi:sortase (surface protein transpeptidase)